MAPATRSTCHGTCGDAAAVCKRVLNLVGYALACRCSVLHKQVKKLDLEHRRAIQLCVNSLGFNKFGPLTWQRACTAAVSFHCHLTERQNPDLCGTIFRISSP